MSLQGSLETFALPDVLVLLASTKKDGELRVVGGKVDGRVWVEKGQIVHSDVNGKEAPSVDAVFELLRLDAGTFSFESESDAPKRHAGDMVDLVLADAQVRLAEWNEIAKVVPHLDVLVDMATDAPGEEIVLNASQWRLLRSVAGGCSVGDLMGKLDVGEFDACRTVKELADARLVDVDRSAGPKRSEKPAPSTEKDDAPSQASSSPAPAAAERKQPTVEQRPAARDASSDEGKSVTEREIEALVDEVARPRRVRATTSGPGSAAHEAEERRAVPTPSPVRGQSPSADVPPATPKVEEAKALVAQLAALEGENEEKIAKKVEEHLARGGELPEVPDGDEPINRGLLLKFLSSVRN
ncbi:MAG TPA: DUF4388 domain-containing protein [Acidimicrobiales bacterium]